MDKIVFQCQYFKIRVREVLLIVVLILLFFGLKACQSNEMEGQKDEKIAKVCDFTKSNVNDFDRLMSRADLCSEGWFQDLEAYINRLEDQNQTMEKKKPKEYKTILKLHKEMLVDLKSFKETQNDKTIEELEKSFKEYKKYYDSNCKKGK